jgi:hypothetical protein
MVHVRLVTRSVALCCVAALQVGGCAAFSDSEYGKGSGSQGARQSNLTPGMVKLHIVKGQTDQTEILEVFGPPNQTTMRDDVQVWTYDTISEYVREDAGTLFFYSAGSRRSSQTSMLLMLYFNDLDVVYDYRLDQINY